MRTWWRGMALLGCGIAGTALAQGPGPGYQPSGSEPIPYMGSQLRNLPPSMAASVGAAPMGAQVAPCPVAPDSPNSLPANIPNAWDEDNHEECGKFYFSVGFLSLMRQNLGHGLAAVTDNASGGIDTGNPPPANAPIAATFNDINERFNYGTRFTIGYHFDRQAVEVSGFYLSQNSSSKTLANPGRLDTFFNVNGSFISAPLGFEGDNGMWLQDDIIRLQERIAMGSGEVNYRWWIGEDTGFSWSLGVRYLDFYDRLNFYTGDDDLTVVDVNGHPNPVLQATYTTTSHNRILAPQLGLEWNHAINCWLAFTIAAKGAWGANFIDLNTQLIRGDGFLGFATHQSDTIFSQLYEGGAFLDFCLMDNARIRAGYNLLWLANISTAVNQIDFNLANPQGKFDKSGSAFFHGPSVEFQFVF